MLNIFFDINYIKTKKVFLTKNIRYSKLINLIIDIGNIFKIPIPKQFIFSGPHKRMNNILKTFKGPNFSINKKKYKNTYIVNFDSGTESLVNNLLKDPENKILVGPLFNVEYQKRLIEYTNKHPNIKKLVASDSAYRNIVYEFGLDVKPNNVFVCPSGVISKNELKKNLDEYKRENKCLVYFKKREKRDLKLVLNFLESRSIRYELFEYGKYSNKALMKAAKKSRFGVYLSCVESQGFAVQELMACNLPLYVWDDLDANKRNLSRYYGEGNFSGTSVTLWSENNGKIVYNYEEFEYNFEKFLLDLDNYRPTKLVDEFLTFESFQNKLLSIFSKF